MNSSARWLASMRLVGDPVVDPIVAEHFAPGANVGELLGRLFRTSRMPEDHPLVSAYLRAMTEIAIGDRNRIERGQGLFELFGPEVLLILGSYSLPLAYAAGNGVQVIYRARRLKDEPIRRLCDTAQMVLNVMEPGQLASGGIGWYATRKVRLIHALVRRHVQADPTHPWSLEWGTPINQEDQAGTLLSFSIAVLHGLRKMGVEIAREDADAYIFAWTAIGRLLGVDDSLLPSGEEDAAELARIIGERQIRATPEGKDLSQQLFVAVESLFPIKGYALSLTHFFLEDGVFGNRVASALQLPPPNWTKWLVQMRAMQKRAVLRALNVVPGARARRSYIAKRFAQAMILLRRPDKSAAFDVPDRRLAQWRMYSDSRVRRP